MQETLEQISQFEEDVLEGLRANQKFLSSKYFYDEVGDVLFQKIMHLDEYYLTRKEAEIFENEKQAILSAISSNHPFRIIELGAGDGLKTKILLRYFLESGAQFTYSPVDISKNVLDILESNLKKELPGLNIDPYQGDYFDALSQISDNSERDVVFFLGSNIGNFSMEEVGHFLSKLRKNLKQGDLLFMGVDLKKDPARILSAYNDSEGITRDFNLNLLDRINHELDGNFDKSKFQHYPYYNPHTGECRSYLISKVAQKVKVRNEEIDFRAWEAIFMEISRKYDQNQLEELAELSGFRRSHEFEDNQGWFVDVIWEK